MPIETAADRAAYFRTADWGVEAIVAHAAGGAPYALPVIYDDAYQPTGIFDGQVFEARELRITFDPAEMRSPLRKGDTVTIDGRTLRVDSVQPDGTGISEAVLAQTTGVYS